MTVPPASKSATLSVDEAIACILDGVPALGPEQVGLFDAAGRTLAHDLAAALTNPPFDASSMDGYAVRAADLGASAPTLKVIGESAAGWPFAGSVRHGEAVRIFTGAAIPDGADTVVIQEVTSASGETVTILESPRKGANLRWRGDDFHEGDTVITAGTRLTPRHV
ncbi:MAG: molybdopterin molybdenumtransferase MoeA, partial [Parvularculaceae bacterium]|nr:molybdopterin molybdenumtransferase MoeA [Parvularculaceae bacterium]